MTKNMGLLDRTLRTIVAVAVAVLYFTGRLTGSLGIVLMVFAGVFLVTSFVSWCPVYTLLGLSTDKQPPASS